jgi:nitronate monooxygenase
MATDRYSSPACYAHEIASGQSEDVPPIDTLLAAERAGARVLAEYLDDYERDTGPWRQLAAVQRDEAKNCAILIDLIRRLDGTPGVATGSFLHKALEVSGRIERLQFLNRGQRWVARRIGEALPHLEQGFVRDELFAMQESHLLNIELCDALVDMLKERSGETRGKHAATAGADFPVPDPEPLLKAARGAFRLMGED